MSSDILYAIVIVFIIYLFVRYANSRISCESLSPFDDAALKVSPIGDAHQGAIIPAIEVSDEAERPETDHAEDTDHIILDDPLSTRAPRSVGPSIRVSPIALTYDAAFAQHAILSERNKHTYAVAATRTLDYWRPIFEEEIAQCDTRDWWDDVDYPMNDPGTSDAVPDM
jgi:hypothetical protein